MKAEFNTNIQKILFCTDFAEDANDAFDVAISTAQAFNLNTIHLLHTIPEPDAQYWKSYIYEVDENVDSKAKHDVDEKIKESYMSKLPDNVKLQVNVKIGKDYMAILEFAQENNIDMLIIGKSTRSSFQSSWLGDAIKKIVRKAPCPVLIVPQR
jgi:nucleotide-binding universal stress UspA family protein